MCERQVLGSCPWDGSSSVDGVLSVSVVIPLHTTAHPSLLSLHQWRSTNTVTADEEHHHHRAATCSLSHPDPRCRLSYLFYLTLSSVPLCLKVLSPRWHDSPSICTWRLTHTAAHHGDGILCCCHKTKTNILAFRSPPIHRLT